MTCAERILQAVVNALQSVLVSDCVHRSLAEALGRDELPAVVVKAGDEKDEQVGRGVDKHTLEIKLTFLGRGRPADQLLDSFIGQAHAALFSSEDLLSLVQSFRRDSKEAPDFDDNDDSSAQIVVTYVAVYLSPQNDLTRLAV